MFFFKKGNNGTVSDNSNTRNHIMNVIKNTGNSDMIIFRQPEEDFNTNSKLIVMPGEMDRERISRRYIRTFNR